MEKGLVNNEGAVNFYYLLFWQKKKKKNITMADVWAGALSCRIWTCFKCVTVFFFFFFFQFLQYHIFAVFFSHNFAHFHWQMYCNAFTRETTAYKTFALNVHLVNTGLLLFF